LWCRRDGITSFSIVQLASDSGNAAALVFFLFDLLYLDGQDFCPRPLIERKARLASLLSNASSSLQRAITRSAMAARSMKGPARGPSRALYRNASMPPTRPAIAGSG
jgi:ATP-dependent DNA ligase